MPTLAEYRALMMDPDLAKANAAANELMNYYIVYNDEYNMLIIKRQEAETALFTARHDPAGVDPAEVLNLQGLILGIESRMKVLDGKMIAFQASTLSIAPPDPAAIDQVKQLTAQVAVMIARDAAIQAIMVALGQIAGIVNQSHGA